MDTDNRLIRFLLNPGSYPEGTSTVAHIETHISHVFLCDRFVYKIKKPVSFGFLDFSSLRKRHFFCHKEVSLNSRLAKETYLGVTAIYRDGESYSLTGERSGRIAEYAVRMRRIPDDTILSNLIRQGRPLYGALNETGGVLASFHSRSAPYQGRRYGGPESITKTTEENFLQIAPSVGSTLNQDLLHELKRYTRSFIAERRQEFLSRRRTGMIRDCHGDLHTQHICLLHPPVIFDCIEFNDEFRTIDVLEDMAFLFMDLEYQGRFDLSAGLSKAYFSQEPGVNEEVLRFYKIYRAVVRGKVEGFRASGSHDPTTRGEALKAAGEYFALVGFYLHYFRRPFNPVVFMGLSGSGKSTIARDFAAGWVLIRSDEVRKSMTGIGTGRHVYEDYGKGIYRPDITAVTYGSLLDRALFHASKGEKVVVDATYLKAAHREEFLSGCLRQGLNPFFVHCFAEERVLRERISRRMAESGDVSDARPETLERQIAEIEEPIELPYHRVLRLNTEDNLHNIIRSLKQFL